MIIFFQKLFRLALLCFIFVLFISLRAEEPPLLPIPLSTSAHRQRHCPKHHTKTNVHPFHQCAAPLNDCIPAELQNLSYATYPTSTDYNTARLNFNKRFIYFPKAIIAPTTTQEAQYIVSLMKKYSLDFAIRSGGHCFEPGSLSSEYIIDLQNFNSIIPDVANQQVYIGAGCLLKNVIQTLGVIDYAIPTGTCPTVGVTGLTLGRRYLKAYYGDHVDALISIKNKYDPANLFHWKQSIPLSRSCKQE